jgi:hypothetical protein
VHDNAVLFDCALSPNLADYFDLWGFDTGCAGILQHARCIHRGEMDSDLQQHLDLVFARRKDDSDETRRGDDAATSSRGGESGMRMGTSFVSESPPQVKLTAP